MVEKKLSKYYWIAGVVTVTLIILILAITFIVAPSFKSIGQVNSDLKDQKANLKVQEEKLSKLKELKVKENELIEQSQVVYRAIPTKKEIGDVFIQLTGLVIESGGTHKGDKQDSSTSSSSSSSSGTSTAKPPEVAGVNTLTYSMETTLPDFSRLKFLLENSEKTLRYLHLDSFKISGKDSFTVTLTYSAFYRNDSGSASEAGGENK